MQKSCKVSLYIFYLDTPNISISLHLLYHILSLLSPSLFLFLCEYGGWLGTPVMGPRYRPGQAPLKWDAGSHLLYSVVYMHCVNKVPLWTHSMSTAVYMPCVLKVLLEKHRISTVVYMHCVPKIPLKKHSMYTVVYMQCVPKVFLWTHCMYTVVYMQRVPTVCGH